MITTFLSKVIMFNCKIEHISATCKLQHFVPERLFPSKFVMSGWLVVCLHPPSFVQKKEKLIFSISVIKSDFRSKIKNWLTTFKKFVDLISKIPTRSISSNAFELKHLSYLFRRCFAIFMFLIAI